MPAAYDVTLETTLPGHTRRRVWAYPELSSHSLAVLTFERLCLAPLAGAPRAELVAAVEAGGNLEDLLGPLAVTVELIAVRRLTLDLLTNSLAVEYVAGGLGTSKLTVTFATPETADACFTKLWRRLGDGYALQPHARDAWSLARAPLLMLVGVLLVTAALALTLSVFEDMASARAAARVSTPGLGGLDGAKPLPKSPLEALLGGLDWRAVCAAGGVAAGASQVWLYRRLTRPPVRLDVLRQ